MARLQAWDRIMTDTTSADAGMAVDLDAIEARARAATLGPWQVGGVRESLGVGYYKRAQAHTVGPDGDPVALALYKPEHHAQHWADAQYLATMDPPTTLALVAEMRRLKAERDAMREALVPFAAFEPALREWRGPMGCLKREHPDHQAILSDTYPINVEQEQIVRLFPEDFRRAAALIAKTAGKD